jgi:hypothetical protein
MPRNGCAICRRQSPRSLSGCDLWSISPATGSAGIFLVTAAAVSWLFTLPENLTGSRHPHLGLLTVLLLPALFFLGLALIPLGCVSSKLREAADSSN